MPFIVLLVPAFIEAPDIDPQIHTVRRIEGTVEYLYDGDDLKASEVVVELYDNPDVILNREKRYSGKQNKIASVITDKNGKFTFPRVNPGLYEVRALVDQRTGANQSSIIVRVRRFWFWPLGRPLKIYYKSFI
jgi:hypothetical protein